MNKKFNKFNRLQFAFNTSNTPKYPLALGGKILQGALILTGTLVISGGTTNGVAAGEGGPINLFKRIRIRATKADGRYFDGLLVDCSARSLFRNAITQRNGGKFVGELSGSTLGSGAAGTYVIYLCVPIYFADNNLRRQKSTALNTDAYGALILEADLGSKTDCFTGTDRTWDTSGLQVQWVDYREDMPGDTYVLIQSDHDHPIQGANKRTQILEIPSDVGLALSVHVFAESTAAATLVDTVLNRLTLIGTNMDYDLFANDIRQKMFDDGWYDPSQTATGQFYVDLTDGNIAGIPVSDLKAIVWDLSNPGGAGLDNVKTFLRRIVAPQNYGAQGFPVAA